MTHNEIDSLVKGFIVDTATAEPNVRVQQVVTRLVSDLFKAIEDLDMTPTEVWKGLEYLAATGAGQEMGLLAPAVGLERFLDIRADEAEARAGLSGGTPRTIEGPLYVEGAPVCQGFARLDDDTEIEKAEVLFMQGTVRDVDGTPLPGAKVEVWHANLMGNYSHFDPSQPHFNLRRTIIADAEGRYGFRSTVPKGYGCPPNGTTMHLMKLLGRHGQRPAHIHFFISAMGHRKLTTQINIAGDDYLWDDFAFGSREGLVPEIKRITSPDELAKLGQEKPIASIDFDFVLYEDAVAPSTEVERTRVAA
jgi:catechol 1,2-dioxygenase